jgi:TolB protein
MTRPFDHSGRQSPAADLANPVIPAEAGTHGSVLASRRQVLLSGGSALAAGLVGFHDARAQTRIPTIDEATVKPRPIAIPDFVSDDPQMGASLAGIVTNDLGGSGLFKPLPPQSFIERIADIQQTPRFADWRAVGAEALVVGRTYRTPDGRLRTDFRVWDVVLGKAIDGQGLMVAPNLWRRLGHQIADRTYERLTGEKGYFDTQIVFVDETGPKARRLKRLTIMDQDGFGPRLLTDGKQLTLTPRFSPSQQEITYIQYVGDQPRVNLMNLETGQQEVVGNVPGLTFAPRFSPDGQRLVMSINEGAATNLIELDLRSKQMRRFTQDQGISTGPCYAPDGRALCFESDREGGGTQVYVMSLANGAIQRISRGGGRYSTPVWSPRGDYIAFTKQEGGQFLIGVMKTDGTGERILSTGYHNEGPTWAPNGRVLMFFRESQGANGGPKLFSVDITGYNERNVPTPAFGSDPAWGPLRA